MGNLREYLGQKRAALLTRRAHAQATGGAPHPMAATVRVEGRSGVRRIRIRDHTILSDSGPDFAGYDFGPGSPELQLGVLGSCLSHIYLIQAADRQVALDNLEVEVSGQMDYRAGSPGHEDTPVYPHNISYTVHVTSPAAAEEIEALHAAVERACPILNLLLQPQAIAGRVVHTVSEDAVVGVAP